MPNAGRVTLEFLDPQTDSPVFWCTYDLGTGLSASQPLNFTCGPTVNTAPVSQTFCGDGSVTFSASITGQTSFKWQQSTNNSTWTDISAGGDFTTLNATTLTVANRSTYSGRYFRIQATNSCGTTNSTSALLTVNPLPTAVFTNSASMCGLGVSRSLGIDFTGTGPWSVTYTTNGSATTVSNIATDPYYFSVSPSVATTYIITSVSDSRCSNSSLTGNLSVAINPNPTISFTSTPSVCEGSSTFSLVYSSTTGTPNRISMSTGIRALSGFSALTNVNLTATPQTITIPSNSVPGDYDFNFTVNNSSTGCTSSSNALVLTIRPRPVMTASSNSGTICNGTSATLTATGASTYSWVSSPAGFTSSSATPSVSPTVNTTYTVTGTGTNGCTNSASTSITVNAVATASIVASATTICTGGQTTLTASGGSAYSWTGPSSYTATGSSITVSPASTGTYTVTATGTNGCSATANQSITVNSGPTITGLSNTTICQGASTTITAAGATTYAWSTGASTASITVSPTATTTYNVIGTTGSCSTSQSVTVTVTSNPVTVSPPSKLLFCGADLGTGTSQLTLTFTSSTSVTCKWFTDNAIGFPSPSEVTTTATNQPVYRSEVNTTSLTTSTLTEKNPKNANDKFIKLTVTSGTCNFDFITELVDINATAPTFTVSSDQTICSGTVPQTLTANVNATAGSGTMGFSYKWQSSTNNTTFTDIPSATALTYTPGALTTSTYFRIVVTTTTQCANTYNSSSVLITTATAVANNTLSTSNACSANAAITGSTPTGGSGTYTYSWESSTTSSSSGFNGIAGVASQSYTPPVPSVTTWYRRLVTSGSCANSTSAALAIHPPLTAVQISNGQTLCSGASITALSVSPSGGETSPSYSYSWERSTTSVSDGFATFGAANSASHTPTTTAGNTQYFRVVVTKGVCSATSNAATIVVNSNPTVSVTPSSATVCSGANTTLTASGGASYSWSPATDLSATTGASVVTTPTASRTYTVTGTSTTGCTNTATATITYGVSPSNPTLSNSSGTICNNATKNLNSEISSGGTNSWYTAPIVDASYLIASPTNVSSAGSYYVFAVSGSCRSNSFATFTLSVNDVSIPVPSALSVAVCSPNTVNLRSLEPVATSGTELRWHTVASSPSGGNLVASPTTAAAGTYYLYAYSTAGLCYGSASSAVTITVNTLPTVSLTSSSSSVCVPNTINLTSNISSPNSSFTYNWYTTSTNPPSTSDLVSDPSSIASNGTYYVHAFNNVTGCKSASPVSFEATFNVNPVLSLTAPSVGCSGSSTSLSVSVTNGLSSPTYQWKIYNESTGNFDNLSNTTPYSGASTATLSISSNTGLDGNAYLCEVTASGCSTNSSIGVIGVSQPNAPTASITHPTCTVSTGTVEVTSFPQDLEFSLTAPSGYQTSTTFNSVASGTYSLTAKDLLNCTNSTSVTVNPQLIPLAPTATNASACVYNLPASTVANNVGNAFSSPVFKWYIASSSDTSSANYRQRSTATSFQSRILNTTTYYVAIVHPTSGCESSRTSITNTVIDPLGTYSPFVNDYVWKGGAVADINNWKTSTNWYQFDGTEYKTVTTIPGVNDNALIPPSGSCVTDQPRIKNENTQEFVNLHIKSGGTLTIENGGILNVTGNWTNDGTFNCGNGTVNFIGTGLDSIRGSNTTTFYNVVVNKPPVSGNKSVMKLFTQAYITGTLTLTQGLFDISTFDVNMDARTINGGSSDSYVRTSSTGRLQRDVASSSRLFPVGRSTYNPATLTNAGTSDKFSIRVIDRLTNNGTRAEIDAQSDSSVVKRTWMIDENVQGGSDVTLRLDWNGDSEHQTGFDPNLAHIVHYSTARNGWENKGSSSRAYSSNQGFVQTAEISNFSPFGISSPEGGVALPVEFLYFNSNCEDRSINVEWATASEKNSDYFSLEYSEDGYKWYEIEKIKSAGLSNEKITYNFQINRNSIINYLRLNQFDTDGKKETFGPFYAACDGDKDEITIYPNPTNEVLYLTAFNDQLDTKASLRLINSSGKIMYFENIDFTKGNNHYQLNVGSLPKGVYFVEFESNSVLHRKKVIVF